MSIEKLSIDGNIIGTDAEHVEYGKNNAATVGDALDALFNGAGGGYTPTPTPSGDIIEVTGTWVSLGTSITWLNDNKVSNQDPAKAMQKGYQDWLQDKIQFDNFVNRGVSGAIVTGGFNQIDNLDSAITPDFVTIEFGINDFGLGSAKWIGSFDDFKNTNLSESYSFARAYRALIDKIYAKNPNAKIILITPRKADGGPGGNWGTHWYDIKTSTISGVDYHVYQQDYAELIRKFGEYMSLPVCDWFAESQANDTTLAQYSYDTHLHPNTAGMECMAKVLIEAFKKVI